MKFYTKNGDTGITTLRSGKKVFKYDFIIQTIGTIDELNGHIALLKDSITSKKMQNELFLIQMILMQLNAYLADDTRKTKNPISNNTISKLENSIDKLSKNLPTLKNFIIPGGSKILSICYITNTVCRRAERNIVLLSKTENLSTSIIVFLNRLSTFLFVLYLKLSKDNKVPLKYF